MTLKKKIMGVICLAMVFGSCLNPAGGNNGDNGNKTDYPSNNDWPTPGIKSVTSSRDTSNYVTLPAHSLRKALQDAEDGDVISLDLADEKIIKLFPDLVFDKPISITIEGNGTILDQDDSTNLLTIKNPNASVTIKRIHFRNGFATDLHENQNGGAIDNYGTLILESCIFSNNSITSKKIGGGAIYSSGSLSIYGCTFFDNTTSLKGSAIYYEGNLTIAGNVFLYNQKRYGFVDIIYTAISSCTNKGSNVFDYEEGLSEWYTVTRPYPGSTGLYYEDPVINASRSGLNFLETDKYAPEPYTDYINEETFTLKNDSFNIVPDTLDYYPTTDFNGIQRIYDINNKTTAGAIMFVQ